VFDTESAGILIKGNWPWAWPVTAMLTLSQQAASVVLTASKIRITGECVLMVGSKAGDVFF